MIKAPRRMLLKIRACDRRSARSKLVLPLSSYIENLTTLVRVLIVRRNEDADGPYALRWVRFVRHVGKPDVDDVNASCSGRSRFGSRSLANRGRTHSG